MIYKGNPVSAGIAIGSAFVYDPKILTAPEDAPVLPMECELERYENAVQAAQAKLREIQAAFTGKDDDIAPDIFRIGYKHILKKTRMAGGESLPRKKCIRAIS